MGRFNLKDREDFLIAKNAAEELYASLEEIYCPYFKDKIAFNAKGLRHLKFKSNQVARTEDDQYARLKLLRLVPTILQESRTLQGIWETNKFEMQNMNSRWENVLKDVVFYEFVAVIQGVRIKVILKSLVGGQKYFWSVIPYWRIDKKNSRRILHSLGGEDE